MLSSKTLSNVNTQVFLMGAHVKFHQGLLFFLHDSVYFVVDNSSYLNLLHLLPLWILHIFFALCRLKKVYNFDSGVTCTNTSFLVFGNKSIVLQTY